MLQPLTQTLNSESRAAVVPPLKGIRGTGQLGHVLGSILYNVRAQLGGLAGLHKTLPDWTEDVWRREESPSSVSLCLALGFVEEAEDTPPASIPLVAKLRSQLWPVSSLCVFVFASGPLQAAGTSLPAGRRELS